MRMLLLLEVQMVLLLVPGVTYMVFRSCPLVIVVLLLLILLVKPLIVFKTIELVMLCPGMAVML